MTSMQGRRIGLEIHPLDVLFFRDARPFGAAGLGVSRLPPPSTLSGAIRTALLDGHGADFHKLGTAVREGASPAEAFMAAGAPRWIAEVGIRGPWLRRRGGVLVPIPATLHSPKDATSGPLTRLDPLDHAPPGWSEDEHGTRPLWRRGVAATRPARGWLTPAGLGTFLSGGVPAVAGEVVPDSELYDWDRRTGVGIDPDRLVAADAKLYGARFLALAPNVSLHVDAILPPAAPRETLAGDFVLALGGERRHACVHSVEPASWPAPRSAGAGDAVVLLTPGLFRARWRPAELTGKLVAACVPGDLPISGWDLARGGPKRSRFAVPAGSVYFLEKGKAAALGDTVADEAEDRLAGFGVIAKGVWNHA